MPVAVAVVGIVIAAAGSTYASYEAVQQAKEGSKSAKRQGAIARENAKTEADLIRERGRRLLGTQRVALAGSGVKIDEGSGDALQQETKRLSERDALLAIKQGNQEGQYYDELAKQYKRKGRSAVVAGAFGAGQTITSGVGSIAQAQPRSAPAQTTGGGSALTRSSVPRYSLLGGTGSENVTKYNL